MNADIKKRLEYIIQLYDNLEEILDSLPDVIPEALKNRLKKKILDDEELKELIDGIKNERPPRFVLVGRTRVGKSSLINALMDSYIADISDVESETKELLRYNLPDDNNPVLSVVDSRGIGEAENISEETAERSLLKALDEFTPDVLLFVIRCSSIDYVDKDVCFVRNVCNAYEQKNKLKLPVIIVLNRADELAPSQYRKASDYTPKKLKNIEDAVAYVKKIVEQNSLEYKNIIPVSSYIDWDGLTDDELNKLSPSQKKNLEIEFDGRYNIDLLFDEISSSIEDARARIALVTAGRTEAMLIRVAKKFTNIFSTISATVALTPIPVSDIIILCALQGFLVMLIATLGGKKINLESAGEFVVSMGGVVAGGFGFRTVAQQASKLLNILFPGAGSAVSAGIAAVGTKLIGEAAIKYYIKGIGLEETMKEINNERALNM